MTQHCPGSCVDEAAVRTVLTLLWDLGHDVLSLTHDD